MCKKCAYIIYEVIFLIEIRNKGIENEFDFVEMFNNKYLDELDNNSIKFLHDLFGDDIKNDELIKSWKNRL